jgi:hypothetical protein
MARFFKGIWLINSFYEKSIVFIRGNIIDRLATGCICLQRYRTHTYTDSAGYNFLFVGHYKKRPGIKASASIIF